MSSEEASNSGSTDARITELEIALTHQQQLLTQLNEVVTDQTRQLLRIDTAIRDLKEQQREIRVAQKERQGDLPHEKPPHY